VSDLDAAFDACPLEPGDRVQINKPGDEFHEDIAIVRIVNLQTGYASVTMQDDSNIHAMFHVDRLELLA